MTACVMFGGRRGWNEALPGLDRDILALASSYAFFLFHIRERHTECNTELWFEGRIGVGMGSDRLGIACVFMCFYKIKQIVIVM